MKFTRHLRIFDYEDIAAILRTGDTAFFEETSDQQLKRQTVWKAAKKLSVMLGKRVTAVYGSMKLSGNEIEIKGYLFAVEEVNN